MLDIITAEQVKKAIDNKYNGKGPLTLEDVVRMEPISKGGQGGSYTIIGSQFGDLTILVWLQFNEKSGVCVRSVKTQTW